MPTQIGLGPASHNAEASLLSDIHWLAAYHFLPQTYYQLKKYASINKLLISRTWFPMPI